MQHELEGEGECYRVVTVACLVSREQFVSAPKQPMAGQGTPFAQWETDVSLSVMLYLHIRVEHQVLWLCTGLVGCQRGLVLPSWDKIHILFISVLSQQGLNRSGGSKLVE